MKPTKLLPQIIGVALVLYFLSSCSSGTATSPAASATSTRSLLTPTSTAIPTPTPTIIATPGTPRVSQLTASAIGLGSFMFTLNPSRTAISKLAITFSHFSCGSASVNGSSEIMYLKDGPAITAGQFTIVQNAFESMGIDLITIHGIFDGTGTRASGTWKVDSGGSSCSGTWL